MKKRDLFPMNEMGLKFIKNYYFFLLLGPFRILEMLFDSLDVLPLTHLKYFALEHIKLIQVSM